MWSQGAGLEEEAAAASLSSESEPQCREESSSSSARRTKPQLPWRRFDPCDLQTSPCPHFTPSSFFSSTPKGNAIHKYEAGDGDHHRVRSGHRGVHVRQDAGTTVSLCRLCMLLLRRVHVLVTLNAGFFFINGSRSSARRTLGSARATRSPSP